MVQNSLKQRLSQPPRHVWFLPMLLAHTLETDCSPKLALPLYDEIRWKLLLFYQLFSMAFLISSDGASSCTTGHCLVSLVHLFQAPVQKFVVSPLPHGNCQQHCQVLPSLQKCFLFSSCETHQCSPSSLCDLQDILFVSDHTGSFPPWSRQLGTGWLGKCPSLPSPPD